MKKPGKKLRDGVVVERTSAKPIVHLERVVPTEATCADPEVGRLQMKVVDFLYDAIEKLRHGKPEVWAPLAERLFAEAAANGWAYGFLAQQDNSEYFDSQEVVEEYLVHCVVRGVQT